MPRTLSNAARLNLNATSATEPLLTLLEITHPDLAEPVRVVGDTQDITVEGHLFLACAFDIQLPEESEGRVPQAQLTVDNVGRELVQWIELSRGGIGAQCRVMQLLRSQPAVIEYDITLDMSGIEVSQTTVTATLGYVDFLNLQAVAISYRPETAPGCF